MLCAQGGDLYNALSSDRAKALQRYHGGKDAMLDVVRGVHFLHSNNVIHRDIKTKVCTSTCACTVFGVWLTQVHLMEFGACANLFNVTARRGPWQPMDVACCKNRLAQGAGVGCRRWPNGEA